MILRGDSSPAGKGALPCNWKSFCIIYGPVRHHKERISYLSAVLRLSSPIGETKTTKHRLIRQLYWSEPVIMLNAAHKRLAAKYGETQQLAESGRPSILRGRPSSGASAGSKGCGL